MNDPPAFGAFVLEAVEVVQAAGDDGAAEAGEAEQGQGSNSIDI